MTTQHVWDYAGNGYVHRLLFNDQDGKMVEHTVPTESASARAVFGDLRWADMEDDDCEKERNRKNKHDVAMQRRRTVCHKIYTIIDIYIYVICMYMHMDMWIWLYVLYMKM